MLSNPRSDRHNRRETDPALRYYHVIKLLSWSILNNYQNPVSYIYSTIINKHIQYKQEASWGALKQLNLQPIIWFIYRVTPVLYIDILTLVYNNNIYLLYSCHKQYMHTHFIYMYICARLTSDIFNYKHNLYCHQQRCIDLLWRNMLPDWLKSLPHTSQVYGLVPVCVRRCLAIVERSENDCPHVRHV